MKTQLSRELLRNRTEPQFTAISFMDASVSFPLSPLAVSDDERQTSRRQRTLNAIESFTDEALLTEVTAGRREALAVLFRRYAGIVRGIAYRVLRDASEADDLLQDIFLLIHRLCETFDPSLGSGRTWILQMTYRRAISRRRYLTSRHFYSHQELDDFAMRIASSDNRAEFENKILGTLGKKDFQELFQELSEDQRQALLLRFVEGYTLPEIAEKMGQTRANIKNHYFRGLEKLRKQLFSGKLAAKRAL